MVLARPQALGTTAVGALDMDGSALVGLNITGGRHQAAQVAEIVVARASSYQA